MEQLNKLQIKAEILTVISKLQQNPDLIESETLLAVLSSQNDSASILDILVKELIRADEQRAILICFLMVKLIEEKTLDTALWDILKNSAVKDVTKTIVLNLLKDLGNRINYENLEEYFENPDEVVDADTKKLLHVAIVNPEAQIDFLDFISTLSDNDKKILVQSLGEDYSSDDLANILNPLVSYSPASELGKIAINILGETKSQLALNTLIDVSEYVEDEEANSLIKKNISKLKLSGVREDNSLDFYKELLSDSRPYDAYTSYPDGHGNQALIFSRERLNETIQFVAVVVNDTDGIVDCFGFNEISKGELARIIDRFYDGDDYVYIDSHVVKTILNNAESVTRKTGGDLSYEYICWKRILCDITPMPLPFNLLLGSEYSQQNLDESQVQEVSMSDFIQRWFFDTEYNDDFKSLVSSLNEQISKYDFNFDLNVIVEKNLGVIFSKDELDLLDSRLFMSSYLKYLQGEKGLSQILFSLCFDKIAKEEFKKNILRKSLYEYYVSLKFKFKESQKMTNIFALKNKKAELEITPKQADLMIAIIESLWVKANV